MTRVAIITATAAILVVTGAVGPARAADSPDPFKFMAPESPGFDEYELLIERLSDDGASILLIEKTFLGRLRILAEINGKVREVVISPNTGEIRRDIIIGDYDPADFPGQGKALGKGKGNGGKSEGKGNGGSNGKGR